MLILIWIGLASGQIYPKLTSCLDCTSQNVNITRYSWCDRHASPVLSQNCFKGFLNSDLCKTKIAKTNNHCYDAAY